jgi:hypothetical protein
MKCSYSTAHTARREALITSGELPVVRGGKNTSGKKQAKADEGSNIKGKGGKAAGKRKCQVEETANEETEAKSIPLSTVTPNTAPPSVGPGPSSTQVSHAPTVGSLHRELTDLQTKVVILASDQAKLCDDNVMLCGWVEVLMGLKDKMMVSVPELQAEMKGLRDGMELEKMKRDMTSLREQMAKTNGRMAQFEDSSSGDDSDEGDKKEADMAVNLVGTLPTSSMFVHPSLLGQSSQSGTPLATRDSGNAAVDYAAPFSTAPMIQDDTTSLPSTGPGPIFLPTTASTDITSADPPSK